MVGYSEWAFYPSRQRPPRLIPGNPAGFPRNRPWGTPAPGTEDATGPQRPFRLSDPTLPRL